MAQDIGFVALVNHSVTPELMAETFSASAQFFTLSPEVKQKYKWVSASSNRGYLGMGKEKLAYGQADIKETFEIGKEAEVWLRRCLPARPASLVVCSPRIAAPPFYSTLPTGPFITCSEPDGGCPILRPFTCCVR